MHKHKLRVRVWIIIPLCKVYALIHPGSVYSVHSSIHTPRLVEMVMGRQRRAIPVNPDPWAVGLTGRNGQKRA